MQKIDVSLAAAALMAAAAWGGQNLLVNGDFEAATIDRTVRNSDWAYASDRGFSCPGWEMSALDRTGVAQPNTPWIAANFSCIGKKAALVQKGNRLSQTFSLAESGRYRLSFDYFCRNGQHGLNATCYLVQGETKTELGTFKPENPTPILTFLKTLDLAAGTYTLLIEQEEISDDRTNLYDNFQLVREDDNLIKNGDFEEATYTANSGVYAYFSEPSLSCPGWQVEPADRVGVSRANTWMDGGAAGKIGTKALYIQTRDGVGVTTASQTFTVTEPGVYKLSFIHLARPSHSGHPCDVELVQGETVYSLGSFATGNTVTPVNYTRALDLAAGEYTLRFRQTAAASGDHANVIDEVAIRKVADRSLVLNGDFEDSRGDTDHGGNGWFAYAGDGGFFCADWRFPQPDKAGIARDGSAWVQGGTFRTGLYGLYLQTNGGRDVCAEQTFVVTQAGDYRLTFEYAARPGHHGGETKVEIETDGEIAELAAVTTTSATLMRATAMVSLDPGVHTFRLRGVQTATDLANMVDNVKLVNVAENLVKNGDFEDSAFDGAWKYASDGSFRLADWTVSPVGLVGLSRPDGTWIPAGLTGIGSCMLYLQARADMGAGQIEQTIDVPEAGVYKLTFDTAARTTYTGGACTIEVEQAGVVTPITTFTALTTAKGSRQTHVALSAGEMTLRIRREPTYGDTTLAIDNLVLVRAQGTVCRWTGAVDGDVAKAANWSCVNAANEPVEMVPDASSDVYIAGDVALQVPPGTMFAYNTLTIGDCTLAADCDWRGLGARVRIDGALELGGHELRVAGFDGLGAIRNSLGELVQNGSFEAYTGVLVNGYKYVPDAVPENWDTAGQIALMIQNGAWGVGVPYAGDTMCMIQGNASISQAVQVPADGTYVLRFVHCARKNDAQHLGLVINVEVDGETVDSFESRDYYMWGHETRLTLTAGAHTLTLRGQKDGPNAGKDPCSWVDGVSLRAADVPCATLRVDTLAGLEGRNETLLLDGALRLVKDGAGTFTVARTQQTYHGGTTVAAGTLKAPARTGGDRGTAYSARNGLFGFFESGVRIAAGAVFDVAGNYDFYRLWTTLEEGGTLKNGGPDQVSDGGSLGRIVLDADATLDVAANTTVMGRTYVDCGLLLGGHTLTADIAAGKTLYLEEGVANGTLKLVGGGTLTVKADVDARTANLVVEDAALAVEKNLAVGDYVASYAGGDNAGDGVLAVHGTFKPTSDKFYGATLQNGATIDVSAVTSDWSTTSAFENGKQTLEFADGATIMVELGSRKRVNGMRLFAWAEKPANIGQVKFTLADGKGTLQATADGVYYFNGLMILLR